MDPFSALILGGSSLLGGLFGSSSADKAAKAQAAAQQAAIQEQQRQYDTTRNDLMPYQTMGQTAGNKLMDALPALTTPWNPSQASLEATPGYQFTRDQGLKATQNGAAARGLGISGAALKGAATYATGLADSTWKDLFNADQVDKTNQFNKLMGTTQLGENAAAKTGDIGSATANQIGQSYSNIGSAQAAGILGGNNALMGGLNNALAYGMMPNGGKMSGLFSGNPDMNLLMNSGGAGSGNGWSMFPQ